jgi:hypothetical protein
MTLDFLKSRSGDPTIAESEREERQFLERARSLLAAKNSNPERVGCPGPEFLQKLARHAVTVEELRPWTQHLSSCGECYREFQALESSNPVRAGLKALIPRFLRKLMR